MTYYLKDELIKSLSEASDKNLPVKIGMAHNDSDIMTIASDGDSITIISADEMEKLGKESRSKNNFVIRIGNEIKDLDEKLKKLRAFVFDSKKYDELSRVERIDLAQQYNVMSQYLKILQGRYARNMYM